MESSKGFFRGSIEVSQKNYIYIYVYIYIPIIAVNSFVKSMATENPESCAAAVHSSFEEGCEVM